MQIDPPEAETKTPPMAVDQPEKATGNTLEQEIKQLDLPKPCPIRIKIDGLEKEPASVTRDCAVFIEDLEKLPKNTNSSMFCSNPVFTKKCVLCNSDQDNIVDHYVNEHATFENYVSRMPPHLLELIEMGLSLGSSKGPMVKGQCGFCETELTLSRSAWANHISVHTGEYMYYCCNCNVKIPTDKHKRCPAYDIIKTDDVEFSDSFAIKVFTCNECKFTQIHEDNLIRHVEKQHKIGDNQWEHYKELNFLILLMDSEPKPSTSNNSTENNHASTHDDKGNF